MNKVILTIVLSCMTFVICHASSVYMLTQEQWAQPKRVENILQMQAIKNTLMEFEKLPGSRLLILYPGGDEGTLWASELKAWLVSMGLSSRQIEIKPGSSESNVIEMRVEAPISGMIKKQ